MKVGLSSADMFDWNDEEISNIIWGWAEESGDHIVPYPQGEDEDGDKNLPNQESSASKLAEKKFTGAKIDFHVIRPESGSVSSRNGGISPSGMDSWPNMASSNDTRMDQASMDDEAFDDSALINKYSSKEIGPQDEELIDFVEYGWENIGSFDDLDRIFSNHEPMFASVNLGNSDKIWSACKYTTDSPPKSFSIDANSPYMVSEILSKMSENMGVNSKYGKRGGQSPDLSFEKIDDPISLTFHPKNEVSDVTEGSGSESKSLVVEAKGHSTSSTIVAENILPLNEFADEVYGQQALPNGQKRFKEKAKGKSLPSVQTPGSMDVNSAIHSKNEMSSSLSSGFLSSFNQQSQVGGPETFNCNQISNSFTTPPFPNYANPAEEVPQTSNFESGESKCQAVLSGYEINSGDLDSAGKPLSSYGKPPLMAPRENIAKLRRRRQMQAMLAIQRQLLQLGDPVSHDLSVHISALESPNQLPAGSNDEFDNLSTLPSIDISSSNEQDESSVLSAAANGYSAEEAVLHRLNEVVSKLDSAMRISIRDSLFRLAKSAVQRQQTTDVSTSTNGGEQPRVAVEDESDANKREVEVTDVETDTNPTDRAVAHLLFHRPMENSAKHPETPVSSISAKLNLDRQAQGGVNLEKLEYRMSSETKPDFSTRDLGSPCQQNMDCMDTTDNGPEYITLEGGTMQVIASQ